MDSDLIGAIAWIVSGLFKGGLVFSSSRSFEENVQKLGSFIDGFFAWSDALGQVDLNVAKIPQLEDHLSNLSRWREGQELIRVRRYELLEKALIALENGYTKTLLFRTHNPATYQEWLEVANIAAEYPSLFRGNSMFTGFTWEEYDQLAGWYDYCWNRILYFYHFRLPYKEWHFGESQRLAISPPWDEFETFVAVTRQKLTALLHQIKEAEEVHV